MFYWLLKRFVVGPVVMAVFRPQVSGLEHVPESGGAILASNHLSFSDSVFLPVVVDRQVAFLAKQEYFTGTGLKGWAVARFFRLIHQVPMDRSGGAASALSLTAGEHVLTRGGLLGIYPEGTRSPDGKLYRGKVGVATVALRAGVPVIPVAMIGTARVQPIGAPIPRIRPVGVRIGPPLRFDDRHGQHDDVVALREVTDEIMEAIAELSGQQYVPDVYAATVKKTLAQRPAGGTP